MAIIDPDIAAIEACTSEGELRLVFQKIIENYGFSTYGFIDASKPWEDDPLLVSTHSTAWIETYKSENFLVTDPCLAAALRTNTPFNWGSVPLPPVLGKRKPGAVKTMEAARDFGINEGLTIPFHFNDPLGRRYTSVCALFWKDNVKSFFANIRDHGINIHFLLIYFAQKMVDLHTAQLGLPSFKQMYVEHNDIHRLTDREKEVLKWAGLGKTSYETGEILHCSRKTVENHIQSANLKLGASNKTHAVMIAMKHGLI